MTGRICRVAGLETSMTKIRDRMSRDEAKPEKAGEALSGVSQPNA